MHVQLHIAINIIIFLEQYYAWFLIASEPCVYTELYRLLHLLLVNMSSIMHPSYTEPN